MRNIKLVIEYDGKLDTEGFLSALADDLNTPNALTEVYRIVKEANIALRSNPLDVEVLKVKFFTLKKMLEIHFRQKTKSKTDM